MSYVWLVALAHLHENPFIAAAKTIGATHGP